MTTDPMDPNQVVIGRPPPKPTRLGVTIQVEAHGVLQTLPRCAKCRHPHPAVERHPSVARPGDVCANCEEPSPELPPPIDMDPTDSEVFVPGLVGFWGELLLRIAGWLNNLAERIDPK